MTDAEVRELEISRDDWRAEARAARESAGNLSKLVTELRGALREVRVLIYGLEGAEPALQVIAEALGEVEP